MSTSKQQPSHTSASEAVTHDVRVEVESQYLAGHSEPFESKWAFSYTVRITNEGNETVKLLSRHWIVTDANDETEETKGAGVVGKQPVLGPGESFEYTSWCPLKTPSGVMRGTYQMTTEDGKTFDIEIAPFVLTEPPYTVH